MNLKQKYDWVSKKGLYKRMKCFSIDLDGTLLNSSHQIPEENFKVLQDLQAQGHTIIINTGRAVEDVIKFEEIQKLQAPIISINGTVIYSSTQEVLYEASLPVEIYKEILPILQDLDYGLWFIRIKVDFHVETLRFKIKLMMKLNLFSQIMTIIKF